MIKRTKEQYKAFAQQFNKEFADKILSAFENQNNGNKSKDRVYADKAHNTKVVLVIHRNDENYVDVVDYTGNPEINEYDDDLVAFIKNNILNDDIETFLPFSSPEWNQKLERLFADCINVKISYSKRLSNKESFREHHKWRDIIPTGYTIVVYDRYSDEFFDKYGNRPWFEPESKKFGVVLIKDDIDKIISECYSVFINEENIVEVGIDTYEKQYRQKGFGYLVAAAYIENCLSRNLEPNWHTFNNNIGSMKLAKKLGFKEISSHRAGYVITST